MFVYLDESGDTGFRFDHGSSRFFVITLLLVDDPVPLHAAVDAFRRRLGFAAGNEFKFYHCAHHVRIEFLRMLRRQEFTAHVLVVDKTLLTVPQLRKRETFYGSLARVLLERGKDAISDAMIVLDESVQGKQSKQQLATYLRRALNTDPHAPKVRGVRFHDSRSDNLTQATDMLSGAIYAKYHKGNDDYVRVIRRKIVAVWEWEPGAAT